MPEVVEVIIRVLPFLLIILGISIAIRRGKFSRTDLYIQKPNSFRKFFFWWASFLVFVFLTEYTLHHYGMLEVGEWNNSLLPSVIKIIGIVLLAPVGEELVFRGMILHKLNQFKVNRHLAIVAQALIFVALHFFSYENTFSNNLGIAQIFIDAVLYGYAMIHTRSIYTPIAMHATGNLIAVAERFFL